MYIEWSATPGITQKQRRPWPLLPWSWPWCPLKGFQWTSDFTIMMPCSLTYEKSGLNISSKKISTNSFSAKVEHLIYVVYSESAIILQYAIFLNVL